MQYGKAAFLHKNIWILVKIIHFVGRKMKKMDVSK